AHLNHSKVKGRVRFNPGKFNPFLGPRFGQREIETYLSSERISFEVLGWDELITTVARCLAEGQIVGWFQGRMEIGPRALGARSILASPRIAAIAGKINEKVKFRETFRPFAPSLPEEFAHEFFDMDNRYSPFYYMLFALPVLPERINMVPAVVHIDGTARPQLVNKEQMPRFHSLLCAVGHQTGVPMLLNTSFNIAGEPIVCSPGDAYKTFSYSNLDLLVLERCLIRRSG
ncbi:MAG TPA: carbamoyltransferase C-terminal domain-containing protein, partial [Blastocatellia bacterium]